VAGISPAPLGVPQIEVFFDIDANSYLEHHRFREVHNKKNKITNDKND
jgi:molecular chaperone DnaK (HSP70)